MTIATFTRRWLIYLGKIAPFLICALLFVSYTESVVALALCDYVYVDDVCYLSKPISYYIGSVFRYDIPILVCTLIISLSIEACKWNKLAILYLALHLLFKRWVEIVELEPHIIYILCFANIIICSYLIYKGLKTINQ